MPLIIDYRPVKLPPEAMAPRRVVTPAAAVGAARSADEAVVAPQPTPTPSPTRERLFRRWGGILGVAVMGFALWLAGPGWIAPGVPSAQARDGLQPFERPGDSFPGSAFYYLASDDTGMLAPDAAKSAWDAQLAQIHGDDAAPITGVGPAARPIAMRGTSLDQSRALQCLTAAIYYEAASEPDAGQRAVAQVVLNRVAHPAWPKTVCGVVYQGSERAGCDQPGARTDRWRGGQWPRSGTARGAWQPMRWQAPSMRRWGWRRITIHRRCIPTGRTA